MGLGPYAWTRAGADRWRRIATGAGRPRRGGYRLAEDVLGDLTTLSRVLAYRSTPFGRPGHDGPGVPGAVARAISRFEAGLERNVVIEALNDYLLALRFVLEGGGPADLGLAMRVAALCAEPERRSETKAIVDRGLALERELWSGEPAPAAEGAPTAAETVVAIEDLTRAILRDAACGHLGSDLRATADEILLADGLAVGEGEAEQRGGAEEWDLPPDEQDEPGSRSRPTSIATPRSRPTSIDDSERPLDEQLWMEVSDDRHRGADARDDDRSAGPRAPGSNQDRVTSPARGGERVHSQPEWARGASFDRHRRRRAEQWPCRRAARGAPAGGQAMSDRVAFLFPRPETTEWDVRELSYDRRRRAEPEAERRVS